MPVGSCLGSEPSGSSFPANAMEGGPPMDTVLTSSVLNAAEQFAFMQQTLLLQIFRVDTEADVNALVCPTCIAFSDTCCQVENGLELFKEFQEMNLQCYWDARLSEAIAGLRYQGYVCPGILVMLSGQSGLDTLTGAWKRRLLISPPSCRISQLGVSNGCVVKPVTQTHTIALQDILCLILARLKQRGDVADMPTLSTAVSSDWAGATGGGGGSSSSGKKSPESLKESIHAALGQLIKTRRVYYTGAKGYFLVTPGDGSSPTKANGLGTRLNHLRHSMRDRTPNIFNGPMNGDVPEHQSPLTESALRDLSPTSHLHPDAINLSMDQSISNNYDGSVRSPSQDGGSPSTSSSSNNSSPGGSSGGAAATTKAERKFNLDRSQSLRVSKKSLRNMSKGGSLRLSKKDALIFKEEDEDEELANEASAMSTPSQANGIAKDPSPAKNFERKNSFLGKLFSKKKSSASKPQLATFSAQFPPPEVVESFQNQAIYTPVVKKENRPQNNVQKMLPQSPTMMQQQQQLYQQIQPASQVWQPQQQQQTQSLDSNGGPKTQLRNGPNGNFVVYERMNNGSGMMTPVLDNNGDNNHIYNQIGNNSSPANIYGQVMSKTGPSPQPAQMMNGGRNYTNGATSPVYGQYNGQQELYQAPPPPLPYRPPNPPNPYSATSHATSAPQSPPTGRPRPRFANSPSSNVASPAFPVRNASLRMDSPASLYAMSSSDPSSGSSSGSTGSSSSGPSSIDSQLLRSPRSPPTKRNSVMDSPQQQRVVFDESLVVIEKSNQELEKKLSGQRKVTPQSTPNLRHTLQRLQHSRTPVDTIHNNRNLSQEVIYEVDSMSEDSPPSQGQSLSRASSQSTIKQSDSSAPTSSFPSISDLTLNDVGSNFKSLTAQKLMAGLSFNSIDTLIEVNAAADARNNLNESTETVDFGVI